MRVRRPERICKPDDGHFALATVHLGFARDLQAEGDEVPEGVPEEQHGEHGEARTPRPRKAQERGHFWSEQLGGVDMLEDPECADQEERRRQDVRENDGGRTSVRLGDAEEPPCGPREREGDWRR